MARRRKSATRQEPSRATIRAEPTSGASPQVWAVALALALVALAVYAPVRGFDYVELDDPAYITENPHVRSGLTLEGVRWALTTGTAANWHPLTWLSHMLDVSLFGVDPGAHHLVNVVLHVASSLLLFLWLHRLTGSIWRSGFVGAVFALHPLHVESVAWVAERKDVLSALLWILTLVAYAHYAARPSSRRMAAVIAIFTLGLMSKPMLVTLPCVLLLLDLWPLRRWSAPFLRTFAPLIKEKLPLFALSAASSVITVMVQKSGGAMAGLQTVPLDLRVKNAVVSTVVYLRRMIWPMDLNILYPLPDSVPVAVFGGALLLLLAVTAVAIRSVSTRPYLIVGWLWYLGTLVPVSGLVQVGMQSMADRYTYLPMIGVAIMVAWLPGPAVKAGRAVVGVAALALVAAMAITTRDRLPVWQNNVTLFTAATMRTTGVDEYTAHLSLGAALMEQKRFDEARQHYEDAGRLRPDSSDAAYGRGLALLSAGRSAEAIGPLEEAVRLQPADPGRRNDLAVSYVRTNRIDDAIREYRQLVEMQPGNPRFAQALSALLARRNTSP